MQKKITIHFKDGTTQTNEYEELILADNIFTLTGPEGTMIPDYKETVDGFETSTDITE